MKIRKKISIALRGKKKPQRSEEHKKHLSESHIGKISYIKGKHKVWDDKTNKKYHYE